MRRPADLGDRWRRVDPITPIVGVVALLVYALHGFDGYLSRDLAIYSYAGQQVVDGVPPYVGILNRTGPLAHLLPAAGAGIARGLGFDDLLGMRIFFMVIAAACVCVVYLLGRDLFASKLAGLAASSAFLSFSGFIVYASDGPREKTPMVLFFLCMLWAVSRQQWFGAGFALSLATLTWQPVFLIGLASMVPVLLASRPSDRIRTLVRFAVGGAVPATIIVVYFAVAGALRQFVDAFLVINARYTPSAAFTSRVRDYWSGLRDGYGVSLWVILAGLAALLVLAVLAIRRRDWRHSPAAIALPAIGTSGVVAIIWTLRDYNGWPDMFVLLPLAAVGVAGIAKEVTQRLRANVALWLTIAWVAAIVSVAVTDSVTTRDHRLDVQRASVSEMLDRLPADATFLAVQSSQSLVLSGKTNLTRYQTFTYGLDRYVDDTWPGGLEGFADWIGRKQPTVITLGAKQPTPWLYELMTRDYQRVGRVPGITWYVNKSVPRPVRRDMSRAQQLVELIR